MSNSTTMIDHLEQSTGNNCPQNEVVERIVCGPPYATAMWDPSHVNEVEDSDVNEVEVWLTVAFFSWHCSAQLFDNDTNMMLYWQPGKRNLLAISVFFYLGAKPHEIIYENYL